MKGWVLLALLIVAGLSVACKEEEKQANLDPYKIGLMGDMTGSGRQNYGPIVEGIRNYFRNLNAKGGIDGHPVDVGTVEDNRSDPAAAIAAMKKFIEGGAILAINPSLSATYAPTVAEAEKVNFPYILAGVCTPENYPPAPKPFLFCAGWAGRDSWAAQVQSIYEQSQGKAKLAILNMDVPIARIQGDYGEKKAKGMGLEVVSRADVPPGTADLTSYADKFISAKADWLLAASPVDITVAGYEALLRRGWKGGFILDYIAGCSDAVVERFKQDDLMALCIYSRPADNLPIHKDINAAAKKYGAATPVVEFGHIQGWINGIMIEQVLRQCGWPCSREKALSVMSNVEFKKESFQGLLPGPIKWTPQNHAGIRYTRVYHWDSDKKKIVPVTKWWQTEMTPDQDVKITPID
ncbi:MAG TPA: ABC transporter substrate-binding protein [Dehalococcoidia bacterium]|nr:ABC transporter substrate-binding protein [Dehalococcoidia bacterium]HLB28514.1 ABC transporter substrate-binding protein [Dehalococcoidia bacterium]